MSCRLGLGAKSGSSDGLDLATLFPRQPSELLLDAGKDLCVGIEPGLYSGVAGIWEGKPVMAGGETWVSMRG